MAKLGFTFTDEDVALLKRLQVRLTASMGKASYIAVIRWALRQVEQEKA